MTGLTDRERADLHAGVCPRHRDDSPGVYVCGPCERAGDAAAAKIKADAVAAALAEVVRALVDEEREWQVQRWGLEHDRKHGTRVLNLAARSYEQGSADWWPWAPSEFKPRTRVQNLIRAAALYQAASDAQVRLSEGNEAAVAQEGLRRCEAALVADLGGDHG